MKINIKNDSVNFKRVSIIALRDVFKSGNFVTVYETETTKESVIELAKFANLGACVTVGVIFFFDLNDKERKALNIDELNLLIDELEKAKNKEI